MADPESGDSRQITRDPVLATMVTNFQWTSGGDEIATVLVPEDRPSRPMAPGIPSGPQVKQTEDGKNVLRTYASLMATPHDERCSRGTSRVSWPRSRSTAGASPPSGIPR